MALELAQTTVPFGRSSMAKADRWLRVLRRLERTGEALMELGVPSGPLESVAEARAGGRPAADDRSVAEVGERAWLYARARGGNVVGTIDLLFGVLAVYGSDFSRALYRHGVTRQQLLDRLTMQVEAHESPYIR